jgi:RNA polymerase sigma factor (sigma-70 family)
MDPLAQFYRRHAAFVWRTLRIARVPPADVDDLAHDVFLVIRRELPDYNPTLPGVSPEDQERAWIYQIASYEAKNHRAKISRRKQEPMDSDDEIPDEQSDSERVVDHDYLLRLLDSTTAERRAVFALTEIEGFTAAEAAGILNIGESNVNRLLRLAREDMRATAEKLERSAPAGQAQKSRAVLLPFGVGAWTTLRDALNPSAETTARVWQRLEATIANLDEESDKLADPPSSPPRPPLGRLKTMGGHLQGALGHVLSAVLGGAIVAWWLLPRPASSIAILRMPVPILVATSSTPAPGSSSSATDAPDSPSAALSASAASTANTPVDPDELRQIRQAHVAFTAGDLSETILVLKAYDRQFPAGRLRKDADSLWIRVGQQAGAKAK